MRLTIVLLSSFAVMLLVGCSHSSDSASSQRFVNDSEYMQRVETSARRGVSSPLKVYWVNPPQKRADVVEQPTGF